MAHRVRQRILITGASAGLGQGMARRFAGLGRDLCEAAMEIFRRQGAGHLVLISSVASLRGMRGSRNVYGASKAAVNALAEGIRSDVWGSDIRVSSILPGYIETDLNVGRRGLFTVPYDKGVDALVAVVEREPARDYVPRGPWRAIAVLMRVLPLGVVRRFT
jgi:NAD(P)-dependent dehydrogenase (short-subunit alcohol dehydrogenase family)